MIYFSVQYKIILYLIAHNNYPFAMMGCETGREGRRQRGVAEHLGTPKQRSSSLLKHLVLRDWHDVTQYQTSLRALKEMITVMTKCKNC